MCVRGDPAVCPRLNTTMFCRASPDPHGVQHPKRMRFPRAGFDSPGLHIPVARPQQILTAVALTCSFQTFRRLGGKKFIALAEKWAERARVRALRKQSAENQAARSLVS